jgi:hypothetical protein
VEHEAEFPILYFTAGIGEFLRGYESHDVVGADSVDFLCPVLMRLKKVFERIDEAVEVARDDRSTSGTLGVKE